MKWHPATMMLVTWGLCALLFVVLPFEFVTRNPTGYGWMVLILFIATFCGGAWLVGGKVAQRRSPILYAPDFKVADRLIAIVATIAILVLLAELFWGVGGDLEAAWLDRDQRAGAFLTDAGPSSSLLFQVGFVTSPIAYAAIAREVIFGEPIRYPRLLLFGFGPAAASALSSGGRGPLLFSLIFFGLSLLVRRFIMKDPEVRTVRAVTGRQLFFGIVLSIVVLVSLNYFVTVFAVRAESAGGAGAMLDAVAFRWGVTFGGRGAENMVRVLGEGNTYLIFVFSWYYTQGLIIGNVLISEYTGPPMMGIYGIEMVTAVMRRVAPDHVAGQFASLDALDVFGFVSGAYGAFFVDFAWFAFLAVFIWGCLAGLVYRKSRTSFDGRWLLPVPFVMQGILFSTINTPLGLTNGLVTLVWMVTVFLISKPPLPAATPAMARA